MRVKVSIVVPIYNVEKYLRECIESILRQTLTELEIILVDDGSTDGSAAIVDEYAKKDQRIKAVHQKNSGYSAAVNRGIKMTTGEYVGIIESDDFVEPEMFEELYAAAKKSGAEIAKGMFYKYNSLAEPKDEVFVNPGRVDLRNAPNGAFCAEDWPQIIAFHASIWSAIYKTELIRKVKIPETAGASYQDLPFMMELLTTAKSIIVVKKPFVHWRNEPAQEHSTSSRGEKNLLMAKNTELALEILRRSGKYDALKEGFFAQAIWTNSGFFFRTSWRLKKRYYTKLRKVFLPLRDDASFSGKFLRPEDKRMIKIFIEDKGWVALYLAYLCGAARRRFRR